MISSESVGGNISGLWHKLTQPFEAGILGYYI